MTNKRKLCYIGFESSWKESSPQKLCKFVDENNIEIVSIAESGSLGGGHILRLFYYDLDANCEESGK